MKVDSKVPAFSFTFSISSPLIAKIKTPARPERSPGKKYLSNSKCMTVSAVIKNMAVEVKTITKVNPTFFFNGPTMFTSGSPSPNSIGTKKIKPVQKETSTPIDASIIFTKIVCFLFEVLMISEKLIDKVLLFDIGGLSKLPVSTPAHLYTEDKCLLARCKIKTRFTMNLLKGANTFLHGADWPAIMCVEAMPVFYVYSLLRLAAAKRFISTFV